MILGIVAGTAGLDIAALTLATLHFEGNVSRVDNAFPTTGPRPTKAPAAAASVTFLLTAAERDRTVSNGMRVGSVMLVRLTADGKHSQVVFLPPDMWLAPAGRPAETVGGSFEGGGAAGLVAAVEGVSRVRIDHYARLDFDGLRRVVDAVGGVDVAVPARYVGQGYIFAAGPQRMDGAHALAYLRTTRRADHAGDAAREQLVMKALVSRLRSIGAFSDFGTMTRTVGAVSSALSVDNSLDDPGLVRLAWDHRSVGAPDFLTAPTSGQGVRDGRAVTLGDDERLAQLWADLRADDLTDHLGEFR